MNGANAPNLNPLPSMSLPTRRSPARHAPATTLAVTHSNLGLPDCDVRKLELAWHDPDGAHRNLTVVVPDHLRGIEQALRRLADHLDYVLRQPSVNP